MSFRDETLVPAQGTITSLGSRGANCGIFLHLLTDADAIPREPQTNLTVTPDYLLRLTGKVAWRLVLAPRLTPSATGG